MVANVLISGASIAGPALAHCLRGYGFAVTVVERAPALRPGGQAVDLRGISKEAVRRMGLEAQVRAARTNTRGMSIVDRNNKRIGEMRADMLGGDGLIAEIEILRGDISEVFYRATEGEVEYLFSDQIIAIHDTGESVDVTFASGAARTFDIVVGADGLHSGVRHLVFGPESEFLRDLGRIGAFFTVPNRLDLDNWMLVYSEPKCSATLRSVRDNQAAMATVSIPGTRADYDYRDTAGQKALLRQELSHVGWEVPWLLEQLDGADDFYFDSSSQVEMDTWSRGRVVLLGDAAFCSSPSSGQGTSLAVVGAYILAGELAAAGGDHRAAFTAYERRMRLWVAANQKMGRDNIKRFAADNRFELWMQNQILRALPYLPGKKLMLRGMFKVINGIALPDYAGLTVGA